MDGQDIQDHTLHWKTERHARVNLSTWGQMEAKCDGSDALFGEGKCH